MNSFDGFGYILVANCNVTPPYEGKWLPEAQRMHVAGDVWGEMKVPYNQHKKQSQA